MSYWKGSGRHQRLFEALYDELVPETDRAPSAFGDAIETCHNLVYHWGNNGLGIDQEGLLGSVRRLILFLDAKGLEDLAEDVGEMIEPALMGIVDMSNRDEDEEEIEQAKVIDRCADALCELNSTVM